MSQYYYNVSFLQIILEIQYVSITVPNPCMQFASWNSHGREKVKIVYNF